MLQSGRGGEVAPLGQKSSRGAAFACLCSSLQGFVASQLKMKEEEHRLALEASAGCLVAASPQDPTHS